MGNGISGTSSWYRMRDSIVPRIERCSYGNVGTTSSARSSAWGWMALRWRRCIAKGDTGDWKTALRSRMSSLTRGKRQSADSSSSRIPKAETRDRGIRAEIVETAQQKLAELSQYSGKAQKKAACALRSHPAYGR